MGKVSREAKENYFDKVREYKQRISIILKRETKILEMIQNDESGGAVKKLVLADEMLTAVSYYVMMNSLSLSLLGIKNEAYLNDARKGCYKSLIYMEELVSNLVDVPFSEYEEDLNSIETVSAVSRFHLLKKMGFSIQSVIEGFGENSKWKWSFVELEGRYATIVKNFLNLKNMVSNLDPRAKDYEVTLSHIDLVKIWLQKSADGYRQKYELSTLRADDFKLAIGYLSALKRIHILLSESGEAEALKRKVDIWRAKMDNDAKKAEIKAKNARRAKR